MSRKIWSFNNSYVHKGNIWKDLDDRIFSDILLFLIPFRIWSAFPCWYSFYNEKKNIFHFVKKKNENFFFWEFLRNEHREESQIFYSYILITFLYNQISGNKGLNLDSKSLGETLGKTFCSIASLAHYLLVTNAKKKADIWFFAE